MPRLSILPPRFDQIADAVKPSSSLRLRKRSSSSRGASWIVYASRRDRDRINKLVMADPRLAAMMDPKSMPFDGKRMFYGGFKTLVVLYW